MESYENLFGSIRTMLPENFELLPEQLSHVCVSEMIINFNFKVVKNSKAEQKINKFKDLHLKDINEC